MAKKVLVKDNKVLSLHSGKVLGAPENYDLDTYLNFYMPFGGTITLRRVGSPTVVELEYSTDGGRTWQIWEEVGNDRTLTLPQEGRMWIRNTSETSVAMGTSTNDYHQFKFQGSAVFANGNITTLINKNGESGNIPSYAFIKLFSYCYTLVTPPFVPECNSFYNSAFYGTFINCHALIKACDFVISGSYEANAIREAFFYCYSLVKPGRIVGNIIKTYGANSTYRYTGINSIDVDIYGLEGNYSLGRTFSDCTNLSKIILRATNGVTSGRLSYWVDNVAAVGDFYCDPELTIETGVSGIPTGWTRHDLDELE